MNTTTDPAPPEVLGPLAPAELAAVAGGRSSPVLMLSCATGQHAASRSGTVPLAPDELRRATGGGPFLLLPAVQKVR